MTGPLSTTTVLTRNNRTLLRAEWVWLADDPAAVRLVISHGRGCPPPRPIPSEDDTGARPSRAVWTLARHLLRNAVMGQTPPEGHVVLRRDTQRGRVLHVGLWTPDGWWDAITDRDVAGRFVGDTYSRVSTTAERDALAAAAGLLDPVTLTEREAS